MMLEKMLLQDEVTGQSLVRLYFRSKTNKARPDSFRTCSFRTYQIGPLNLNINIGIAVDGDGNGDIGTYQTVGMGAGVGTNGGISVSTSTGQSIADLAGPFGSGSIGGGAGPDASIDGFSWPGSHGQNVTGTGATFGLGVGGGSATGGTYTWIQTF